MKIRSIQIYGFSLLEVLIAVFILAVAIIPVVALISRDSINTVVLANSEFSQHYARTILETMLDQIDFDDLLIGSPAILTGESAKNYGARLFPSNEGNTGSHLCEGITTNNRGWQFHAYMEAHEIPDNQISFSSFKNPDIFHSWVESTGNSKSLAEKSSEMEKLGNPSYVQNMQSIYAHPQWGSTEENYTTKDFNQDKNITCLMKVLVLRIRWNNIQKSKPLESEKITELWLVTHKARLKKSSI